MQSYIKLHKISFSSLVKIFSIKTTSLINNYLYLYIIIDNLIIMQVCKKINIKNWNNEECQGGGALEKRETLETELNNLSQKIVETRVELEILKIDKYQTEQIKLLEGQISAMYEYLDKLILRIAILKNKEMKLPPFVVRV